MFNNGIQNLQSLEHQDANNKLRNLMKDSDSFIPHHWNRNLLSFLTPANYARSIYLSELYAKVVDIPGVIVEFGVNYGSTFISFINLRSIHEPYNHTRKVIGFDTFSGFPAVSNNDTEFSKSGDYGVVAGWEKTLNEIATTIESLAPLAHITKFELVKGDVSETLDIWLKSNPGLTIALAHFDLDIYEPTKFALSRIQDRLVKGSILAFDEFSDSDWPGETLAVLESFQLKNRNLRRSKLQNNCAYLTVD